MDPIKIENIQAINKYKQHQTLNNLFLYSLTALTCTLFFSSLFWYPSLCSSLKAFLFLFLPKICLLFFSSKFLFIVGNLIVVVLVGESKIFASDSSPVSDVYYDEYVERSQSLRSSDAIKDKKGRKFDYSFEEKVMKSCEDVECIEGKGCGEEKIKVVKERDDLDGEEKLTEEFNKRADDFIARVNKQRRLEAKLLVCSNE